MQRRIRVFTTLLFLATLSSGLPAPGWAQTVASQPPLFFREGWNGRNTPGFLPLNKGDVGNPNLELQLYGPGANGPARDPENTLNVTIQGPGRGNVDPEALSFIWSGMAEGNWAVTLKHKDSYVDLTRPGSKIRWRSWQDGAVQVLRPVLKLADGTYVLGLQGSGTTADFETTDLIMADMRWVDFDPDRVLDRGNRDSSFGYAKPDLRQVDEIGFTTLSRGGGHGVGISAHVDWIEVYGAPVPRSRR
jgi:hypothetical protein